ncbi:hypothetical protein [Microcystis aeruginosa]|uniref:Uncharacterized protein n=1 Tax=Microcystis aeruginosa NIES-2521 TaxID=2303983 RepID=A0A5A5SA38_MICAE|nr:hypothetical protein [Microcystis aeruginosa]GCA81426.1 hypothetical protein MiTs_03442 [Microcystis aeruginosa NIES-2521]
MSKVLSFSISDRYLDKLRSLYPELTENLAAKQFLIDQLDADSDDNLDTSLDDNLKILIEKSLEDRLGATEKSISKWILDFDNRIKDIDREMKDRSIAIDHQIKAIEVRLDESLDKNLDNSLDDSLDSSLYESYSEIFIDRPDENLDDSLDTKLNDDLDDSPDKSLDDATIDKKHGQSIEPAIEPDGKWLTLQEILGQQRKDWPKSIEGLRKKAIREEWPQRNRENRKEYQIP